jgi:hypothetical protein
VKDNFLSFKTELAFHPFSSVIVCPVDCPINFFNHTISFNDTSPPPLLNNNLYLLNSILLI